MAALLSSPASLRGIVVGAGYFSRFHADPWRRRSDVGILAGADRDPGRARAVAAPAEFLATARPDFPDHVTPPETQIGRAPPPP